MAKFVGKKHKFDTKTTLLRQALRLYKVNEAEVCVKWQSRPPREARKHNDLRWITSAV